MLEQLVLLTLKDIGKENGIATQNLHNFYTPSRTRSNIDTDVTVMIAFNDLLIFICLLVVIRREILENKFLSPPSWQKLLPVSFLVRARKFDF